MLPGRLGPNRRLKSVIRDGNGVAMGMYSLLIVKRIVRTLGEVAADLGYRGYFTENLNFSSINASSEDTRARL